MTELVCCHCGKPESEHCVFEPAIPEDCQCDIRTWGDEVIPICDEYVGNDVYCKRCEHERKCHKGVMGCGHPVSAVYTGDEGTSHCEECEREGKYYNMDREGNTSESQN